MPRGEASLPPDGVPALVDLARTLRSVRGSAGLTYRGLAEAAAFSSSVLSTAAGGRELPSWPVTWAYARACDPQANESAWLERWRRAERAVGRTKEAGRSAAAPGEPDGGQGPAPHPLVAEFGRLLDAAVKGSGKSLRQIARSAGYAVGTLSRDIRGSALPRWDRVRDVLQVLGVDDHEIDQVWNPRWRRADQARRASAVADLTAVPPWYLAVRAAARRRLAPHDPMHEGTAPAPWLDVQWSVASAHLHDDWEAPGVDPRLRTAQLAGRGADITDVYRTIPSGRLVVLGSAGAGASNLVRRLGLGLTEQRVEHSLVPVPLLLPLVTWAGGTLQEWVDDPATRAFGEEAVRHLTEHGLLLPLLDGFHHLTPAARSDVLAEANALDPSRPIVLTSRLSAYADVVERTSSVLSGSAAIHLQALGPAELAAFLPAEASHQGRSWGNVTEALLRGDPRAAALREVCATPLLAATARRRYCHAHASPDALLDVDQFPDAASLRAQLVEHHLALRYGAQQNAVDAPPISLTCLRSVLGRASRRTGDPTLVAPTTLVPHSRRPVVVALSALLVVSLLSLRAGSLLLLPIFLLVLRPVRAKAPRTARRRTGPPGRHSTPLSPPVGGPLTAWGPRDLMTVMGAIALTVVLSLVFAVAAPQSSKVLGSSTGLVIVAVNAALCLSYLVVQFGMTLPVEDTQAESAPAMFADDARWAWRLVLPFSAAAAVATALLTWSPAIGVATFAEGALLGLAPSAGIQHYLVRPTPLSPMTWFVQRQQYEHEIAAAWPHLHREEQAIRDMFQDPLAGDARVLVGRAVDQRHCGDLQVLMAAVCVGVLVPVGGAFRLSHPALAAALPVGTDTSRSAARRVVARWLLPTPKAAS